MKHKPLHKNSGKYRKSWTLGKLYFELIKAEDGLWSHQNIDGTVESQHLVSLKRIKKCGFKEIAYNIIIGKYNFTFTKMCL